MIFVSFCLILTLFTLKKENTPIWNICADIDINIAAMVNNDIYWYYMYIIYLFLYFFNISGKKQQNKSE